jgi:hypothetical protein
VGGKRGRKLADREREVPRTLNKKLQEFTWEEGGKRPNDFI